MKRYFLLVISACSFSVLTARSHSNEQTGKTFMFTRPVIQHLMIDQALWYSIIHSRPDTYKTAGRVTTVYQHSIDEDKTARYFLFDYKDALLVAGDDNPCDVLTSRDVRAEWLNLPSDYRGILTLNPRQQQMAITFQAYQDVGAWTDISFFKNMWFSIAAPIGIVENDLQLNEKKVFNPGMCPHSIIDAFNQSDMCYAKITGARSAIELAEINIKMGRTYLSRNNAIVAYYSKLSLPTSRKQNAAYTFDPFVGNNGHFGFGTGVNFQFQLTRDTDPHVICFFINLEGTFYIRAEEHRTFDLYHKPWSRYMRVVEKNGRPGVTIPAANILTQKVLIHPYNTVDFSTGWRFKTASYEGEFGYNIWGHGDEKLECIEDFPHGRFGIAGNPQEGYLPEGCNKNVTASKSTIQEQASNDTQIVNGMREPLFVPITLSDLDINSAASQSALNHKIHGFLGWHSDPAKKIEGFVGAGFFYDIPQKNSALKLWGVWLTFGASL